MDDKDLKGIAVYVHIPFCDHKCIYCDFYSIITSYNASPFLNSLLSEISYFGKKYSSGRIISSIFFGGGTPSLMEPEYLHEIINSLKNNFLVSDIAEITIETNPGTVTKEKLKEFREVGINRISIGVQSFNDYELRFLTRIHNSKTATQTLYDASAAGFNNISLDLIFNLPGQTKEKWINNLTKAVQLPVNHISAYSLILERGTILNKMVLDDKVKLQDDDYDADLYETTIDFLLANGFYQYEISNFTKPGFECMHNNAYWHHKEYLGFGTSSHSFVEGKRWWNYSSLRKFIGEIEKNRNAIAGSEIVSSEQLHDEYVMLSLRSSGIRLNEYKEKFGDDWLNRNYSYFQKLKNENYIEFFESGIRLTKSGYAVCDEILKNIL